jgi:hypothetical protein
VIRINVHLVGETRTTHHTHSTLSPRIVPDHMYITRSTHSNLSRSPHEVETDPYTQKKSWRPKNRPVWSSSWVTSFFLSHDSLGVGERDFSQVVTQLHWPIGPIYQHAIDTFNTCSRGPTHRSLTETGGGYNHLRVSPGLRLSNLSIASSKSDVKHLSPIHGLSTTRRLPKPMSTPSNG